MHMFSLFDIRGLRGGGGLIERGLKAYFKFSLDKGGLKERGLKREGELLWYFVMTSIKQLVYILIMWSPDYFI